jgi:hypothetical protein
VEQRPGLRLELSLGQGVVVELKPELRLEPVELRPGLRVELRLGLKLGWR